MSFIDISINSEYRSLAKDIVKDFFIPVLNEAVSYKRAVGFFSSSALIELSRGLCGLIKNQGRVCLICSPKLSPNDIDAIASGYRERSEIVQNAILREITEPNSSSDEKRLNFLANLIKIGYLDIKIAFIQSPGFAIYHEKMGIFQDRYQNIITFSGSMNESRTAFYENYETIDVYCSWKSDFEKTKIAEKVIAFDKLWSNLDDGVEILEFPKICKDKLLEYARAPLNTDLDDEEFSLVVSEPAAKIYIGDTPHMPSDVKLYDYQLNAIDTWLNNEAIGVFDMATGTGKTFTALGAITKLFENVCDKNLCAIIVCPFVHLVNQWVEELKLFNITNPIIGYSGSPDKKYKKRLRDSVLDFNIGVKSFFCFITTNSSFITEAVQNEIAKLEGNSLLVVDEAHNFGSEKLKATLKDYYKYRLALSATFERHNDQDGTTALQEFFGEKCVEYSLRQAIEEDKLTKYYYYPIVTILTPSELDAYNAISKQVAKMMKFDDAGKASLSDQAKLLLIKRARVVAGAANKIPALIEQIGRHKDDTHILIYCGAANVIDGDYIDDDNEANSQDNRQINVVCESLYKEYEMNLSRFTSLETHDERKRILAAFEEGDNIQALVAIKCLDEGVNIPKVKIAFILASTTNPKEFIQRRGRVLRKAKGKASAVIYDFVTLPRPIDSIKSLTLQSIENDLSLIKNNIERIKEFASLSQNPAEGDKLVSELKNAYKELESYKGR